MPRNYYIQIKNDSDIFKTLYPDTSRLATKAKEVSGEVFERLELSGEIKLSDSDFDFVTGLTRKTTEAKVYENGYLLGFGSVDLQDKINYTRRTIDLEIVLQDEYTPFDKLGDTNYNILEVEPPQISGNPTQIAIIDDFPKYEIFNEIQNADVNHLVTCSGAGPDDWFLTPLDTEPVIGITFPDATWTISEAHYSNNSAVLISGNTWKFNFDIDVTFVRETDIGYYAGAIPNPPDISGTWTFLEDKIINNIKYPIYARPYQNPVNWTTLGGMLVNVSGACIGGPTISIAYADYTSDIVIQPSQVLFSRHRFVNDVFKFIVNQIDNTIQFDNSGTSTDSFRFFKQETGESHFGINKPYALQMIGVLSDWIPNNDPTGTQKSEPATVGLLSFNTLYDFYRQWGLRYKLENRSGTYYFILDHKSQITKPSGNNPDLTDLAGMNWINNVLNIEYEKPTYDRIHNVPQNQAVSGIEFRGTDVIFTDLDIRETQQFGSQSIITDISAIRKSGINALNAFDDLSVTQFVIMCTQVLTSSLYLLRQTTGLLLNEPTNNSELSFPYFAQNYLSELPDKTANVNGVDIVLPAVRLAKRKKINFVTFVEKNIKESYDFTETIQVYNESGNLTDAEIEEMETSNAQNIAKIKVKL